MKPLCALCVLCGRNPTMSPLARSTLVFLGAGLGGVARYWIGLALKTDAAFPWPTFAINATGSLLIGLVLGRFAENEPVRLLLAIGVLGGYTTFSSFSYETLTLLRDRNPLPAFAYAAGSVVVGLCATALGLAISQWSGTRSV